MSAIETALDSRSATFRANKERMDGLVAELRKEVDRIREGVVRLLDDGHGQSFHAEPD